MRRSSFSLFSKPSASTRSLALPLFFLALSLPAALQANETKACHSAHECIKKAQIMEEDRGDLASALPLYARACSLGNGAACFHAGLLAEAVAFSNPDKAGNHPQERALGFFRKGCASLSYGPACYQLSLRILNSHSKDETSGTAAAQLMQRACDLNVAAACSFLSERSDDPRRKTELARKACQLNPGYCSLAEQLSPSDRQDLSLLRRMCLKGHIAESCIRLAEQTSSDTEAASWLLKGCEADSGEACFALALAYEKGQGVPRSTAKAKALLAASCHLLNHPKSCARLQSLRR